VVFSERDEGGICDCVPAPLGEGLHAIREIDRRIALITALWATGAPAQKVDDGLLMPTRKNQPPPDLRYFTPALK
jgi:hypothetical protein